MATKPVVFLTGTTGFIGRHVLQALCASGYPVRALVRRADVSLLPENPGGPQAPQHTEGGQAGTEGVDTVLGDLRRPGDLVPALRGCRYLVHCAALYSFAPADRRALWTVNVAGTAGLLEAARIAGVERAVVTSSGATVGPARNSRPATERDRSPEDGPSSYHRSKVEQEYAALAARVPTVLVLPTTPVGPGDAKPTPTGRLIVDYAAGRVFAVPPGGGANLVDVRDVARAHVLALERGQPGHRYVIGGENLSFDAVWQMLSDLTRRPLPRMRLPYRAALALGWMDEARCRLRSGAQPRVPLEGVRMSVHEMYADSGKARAELGYEPGPVRPALQRAVAWYRAHGYG